jgi:protein-glutamine gamma-glutamyltransferase
MTLRDALLRRIDLAARAALLAAGLFAQWAMWTVAHSRIYPVAAVVLIGISIESARRRFVSSGPSVRGRASRLSPRGLATCRVLGCVIVVEVCVGLVGALQSSDEISTLRSMALPIGLLLVTVQAAHAFAVESRRDAKLGIVIVVAILASAGAFALTAALTVPMVATVLALLTAAALLQRGTIVARMHDVVGPARTPVLRAVLLPVSSAVVIGALVFLALPNSTHLGTRTDFRYVGVDSAGSVGSAGLQTRATSDPGAATLDLRMRGALSDAAVFAVSVTAPSYWQGEIFDTFDGTNWTATTGSPSPTTLPAPTRTDAVHVLSAQPLDVVLAPGQAVAYDGPGRVAVNADGTSRLTGAGTAAPWTYEVTSQTVTASAATLRSSTGSDPADQKWTAVETGLPSRVSTLAQQLTVSATTRYDAVSSIDDYVRSHETYDLNSPVPAAGVDAVDDFLFVSHRGFCEQFATAAVVMLRSVGIPARLVTGYSHGDLTAAAGERVMRGVDAHAWIQVWYPGIGWIASDPTATAVLPAVTAPVATAVTATTVTAATVTAATPTSVAARPAVSKAARAMPLAAAMRAMPGGRLGWLVVIVVGSALVVVLLRWFARRWPALEVRRPIVDPRQPGDGPVLQAYLRLDAALGSAVLGAAVLDAAVLGAAVLGAGQAREPHDTVREVARRIGGPISARAEVVAALDCLERECYAVRPPADSEVSAAVDVFDRLREAVGSQQIAVVRDLIPR